MSKASKTVTVSLFSTLAVQRTLQSRLLPQFSERNDALVQATFDPTRVLLQRIAGHEAFDVIIAIHEDLAQLGQMGAVKAESIRPMARTGVGLAVPLGAPVPSLADTAQLTRYLLAARSVAYSLSGASGRYFSHLLTRLGIAEAIDARATRQEKGFTALALLDGRADVAVQQLSELMSIDGVRVVGPLPDDAQHYTHFSAAIATRPQAPVAAAALLDWLTGTEAAAAYEAHGLQAIART
jgi:molybdate transport system substrate-binding protein